jgi:hypothetical protein
MLRRTLRLGSLLGIEVAVVAGVHLLGRVDGLGGPGSDPVGWLRSSSPEEVVAGTVRLVTLACAWWLLASTVLYIAVRITTRRRAAPALTRLVLPAVRRRVDRALAVSMLASAVLGGGLSGVAAAGEPEPPATIAVRDGRAIASFPVPAVPGPAAATPPAPPPVGHHVVAPGESLWTIAAAHAGSTEVGSYWARVVEANRAALRSGNPNLIYPGEIVELP